MTDATPLNPKFVTPPNHFKMKVGSGGISDALLKKSQQAIDSVKLDFLPYAKDFLTEFSTHAKTALDATKNRTESKENIIGPVMQIKANGGMFHYQLLSDVADIALQFIEAIEDINEDAYDVLQAHENTIQAIISNKMQGDGGKAGDALVNELHKACTRYFEKYKEE